MLKEFDIMIDLETLSTRPNSVILTLAAVRFDRYATPNKIDMIDTNFNVNNDNIFYRKITIDSCLDIGLVKDQKTVDWWNQQTESIRNEAFSPIDRIPIKQALEELTTFFGNDKKQCVWSHGSCFDCVILDEAFNRCGMQTPWKYFNVRDTRTLFELSSITHNQLPIASHHAVFDCLRQIYGVNLAISKIYKL